MDNDTTWYSDRPWADNIALDADPAPLSKGHSPHISAHICCGQTAGWIMMALSTKVGLGPGRIVLHGDPARPS